MPHRSGRTTAEIREGCELARQLIPWAEGQGFCPQGRYSAALLWAGIYTQDPRLLHSLGGFDLRFARALRDRARAAGVWVAPRFVGSDWGDELDGEVAFSLDLLAVLGVVTRRLRRGEVLYSLWGSDRRRKPRLTPLPPVSPGWVAGVSGPRNRPGDTDGYCEAGPQQVSDGGSVEESRRPGPVAGGGGAAGRDRGHQVPPAGATPGPTGQAPDRSGQVTGDPR